MSKLDWFGCVGCSHIDHGCREKICTYRLEQFKEWCIEQKKIGQCNDKCIWKSECLEGKEC
ncbi:MAG: hypothetical protein ACRCX2_32530 [Paraclostridium sp.]